MRRYRNFAILFTILFAVFTSCHKDSPENEPDDRPKMTVWSVTDILAKVEVDGQKEDDPAMGTAKFTILL